MSFILIFFSENISKSGISGGFDTTDYIDEEERDGKIKIKFVLNDIIKIHI
jgi:hypothetical protein